MEAEWQCEACTTFNAGTEIACTVCFTTQMSAKDVAVTWEWNAEGVWIPYDVPTCIQVEEAYQQKLDRVGLSSGFFATQRGAYEIQFQWEGRARKPGRRLLGGMLKTSGTDEGKADSNAKCLGMTQINIHSHNPRQVRRIDTNDDSIFVAIDKRAILNKTDKCGVCQETFIEEEDSEDETPSTQSSAPALSSSLVKAPTTVRANSTSSSFSSSSTSLSPAKLTSSSATPASTPSKKSPSPPKICEEDVVHLAKCRNHYFHRDCISQWVKLKHTCPFCKTPI